MIQPSLFEKPAKDPFAFWNAPPNSGWSHAPGPCGWVAYDDDRQLATESWNCPGAAVRAAIAGKTSKKFYRQHLKFQQTRKRES